MAPLSAADQGQRRASPRATADRLGRPPGPAIRAVLPVRAAGPRPRARRRVRDELHDRRQGALGARHRGRRQRRPRGLGVAGAGGHHPARPAPRLAEGRRPAAADFPDIYAERADELNAIDKRMVRAGTDAVAHWRCAAGHVWRASVGQRTIRQTRCGDCHTARANQTNSVAARWPELLDE